MGKPYIRALLVASALLACTPTAHAAGLGKLTVMSDLGQPLRAEIDVVAVEKGEMDSLKAKLAAVDAYVQNNLPYPPPSLGLKLALEKRASGQPYISATTAQPVNEPFVDILVDLTWNGGRILRAYTALLDPPAYAEEQAAAAAPPAGSPELRPAPEAAPEPQVETQLGSEMLQPAPAPAPEMAAAPPEVVAAPPEVVAAPPEVVAAPPAEPLPGAPMEAQQPPPVTVPPPGAETPAEAGMPKTPPPPSAPEEYTVVRGDTLSKIAREHMADDVSLEQMLVVLFRSNPEAFSGKNMNRLKAGKVLQLPDPGEVAALDAKQARREVRMQTADFNAYRERIAAAAGMGAPTGEQPGQTATGEVTGTVQDKGAPAPGQPKEVLKLSEGESAAAAAAQQRVRALEEEVAAREKTIKEQTERVAKLEKTVKDMQALLDIKSKGMADAQRQAAPPPAPAPIEAPMPAPPAAAAPSTTATPPATTATPPAPPPPPVAPAATSQPSPPVAEPPAGATPPAEPPKKPKPRVRMAAEPPPSETSLVDELLGNPLYLGGAAAVLALLAFLGFRTIRNRRSATYEGSGLAEKKNDEVEPPLTHTDIRGGMAAAARTTAPAAGPVSEEVDPLAEAEIYLAYGRDGQAEEILREAMQANPRRYEIHVKLLEIYAKRRDTGAFDTLAREVYAGTGGQGEIWAQVARLGYPLDPQNPRYVAGKTAGAEPVAAAAVAAAASVPSLDEKLDFNIGLEDTSHGTRTDIDLTRLGGAAGTSTDIDLSNLGAPGSSEMVDLSTVSGLPQSTLQVPEVDLSLGGEGTASKPAGLDFDFDLSGLTGGGAPAAPRPSPETTQIFDRSLMQTVADVGGDGGLGTVEFDLSKISLDGGATGKTEPTLDVGGGAPSIPEIDLSGISLDLGTDSTTTGGATTSGAGKDDHWYDVQTKFDLAKAYQEMGDKEGAREILQEVLAEGDSEQKAAAQRVLEALA